MVGYFGQLQAIRQELTQRFAHMPDLVNTIVFLDDGSIRVQYNARVRDLGGSTPQLIYRNLHNMHAKDSELPGVRAWHYGELYTLILKPNGDMKLEQWDPQDAKWKPREANRDTLEKAISSKRTELNKLKLMQSSMQRSGGNAPTSQRPR